MRLFHLMDDENVDLLDSIENIVMGITIIAFFVLTIGTIGIAIAACASVFM